MGDAGKDFFIELGTQNSVFQQRIDKHRTDLTWMIDVCRAYPHLAQADTFPVPMEAEDKNNHGHQGDGINQNAITDIPIRDTHFLLLLLQRLNECRNYFRVVFHNTKAGPFKDIGIFVLVDRHHALGIGNAARCWLAPEMPTAK